MRTFKYPYGDKHERECTASVKVPLIQSTPSRILIAQIFDRIFKFEKTKLLRKRAVDLLPNNRSHHVKCQIKLTGLGICMK